MPARVRLALAPAVAALALVGLGGCGRPAVLDGARTEARIGDSLAERFDVEVAAVTCPDEISVEEGGTFTCTAEVAGEAVEVDVEQRDGEGALEVSPQRAVLVVDRVATDITEVLADQFERDDVDVSCPGDPVRVEEPGATFECTAVDGPQEVTVEVRVRDTRGAVTYAIQQ